MGEAKWEAALSAAGNAQSCSGTQTLDDVCPKSSTLLAVPRSPLKLGNGPSSFTGAKGRRGGETTQHNRSQHQDPNLNVLGTNRSLETSQWVLAALYWQQLWPRRIKDMGSPEQVSARMSSVSSLHRDCGGKRGPERRSSSFGCDKGTQVSPQSRGEGGAEDDRPAL